MSERIKIAACLCVGYNYFKNKNHETKGEQNTHQVFMLDEKFTDAGCSMIRIIMRSTDR